MADFIAEKLCSSVGRMALFSSLALSRNFARNVVFFSSRSRHTGCSRDWSSDVCSSDLCCCWAGTACAAVLRGLGRQRHAELRLPAGALEVHDQVARHLQRQRVAEILLHHGQRQEIGRASCRERGEISGVAVSLKKKKSS